ncbi:MAG: hypothetical protein ACFN2Z_06420, partial [Oribacterium sp.]
PPSRQTPDGLSFPVLYEKILSRIRLKSNKNLLFAAISILLDLSGKSISQPQKLLSAPAAAWLTGAQNKSAGNAGALILQGHAMIKIYYTALSPFCGLLPSPKTRRRKKRNPRRI